MYASSSVPCPSQQCSGNRENIPINTYENCAVLDELSRLSDNSLECDCCQNTCDCKCTEHACSEDTCTTTTHTCNCKNHCAKKKCSSKLTDRFGIDDAIILLLIILFITDGNNCNDFMIPVLLGVLLLT